MKALQGFCFPAVFRLVLNKERYMFDQDDQRTSQPYTGPAVLRTLTWAPRTKRSLLDSISDFVSGSDEPIPMPLQASTLSPMDFDFGKLSGALEISESEPSAARLEKVAINVVKMSQFFGFGLWIEVSREDYQKFCGKRMVPRSEFGLLIELTLRKCLIARGDKYAIGPYMAFLLSKYSVKNSVAA